MPPRRFASVLATTVAAGLLLFAASASAASSSGLSVGLVEDAVLGVFNRDRFPLYNFFSFQGLAEKLQEVLTQDRFLGNDGSIAKLRFAVCVSNGIKEHKAILAKDCRGATAESPCYWSSNAVMMEGVAFPSGHSFEGANSAAITVVWLTSEDLVTMSNPPGSGFLANLAGDLQSILAETLPYGTKLVNEQPQTSPQTWAVHAIAKFKTTHKKVDPLTWIATTIVSCDPGGYSAPHGGIINLVFEDSHGACWRLVVVPRL